MQSDRMRIAGRRNKTVALGIIRLDVVYPSTFFANVVRQPRRVVCNVPETDPQLWRFWRSKDPGRRREGTANAAQENV